MFHPLGRRVYRQNVLLRGVTGGRGQSCSLGLNIVFVRVGEAEQSNHSRRAKRAEGCTVCPSSWNIRLSGKSRALFPLIFSLSGGNFCFQSRVKIKMKSATFISSKSACVFVMTASLSRVYIVFHSSKGRDFCVFLLERRMMR